jgi:hypothetical protein
MKKLQVLFSMILLAVTLAGCSGGGSSTEGNDPAAMSGNAPAGGETGNGGGVSEVAQTPTGAGEKQ